MGLLKPSREDYFERLTRLISLESEAEKNELLRILGRETRSEAEASGDSLINLTVLAQDIGLAGRILSTFGKRNRNLFLPWTRLDSGTPVVLSEQRTSIGIGKAKGARGVVSRLQKDSIQVAFADWPEDMDENSTFRLDRSTDEVARSRQRLALERGRDAKNSRLAVLRDVLLGKQNASFHRNVRIRPLDPNLNESQIEAVGFAMSAEDVAVIHGPPGTGKTTALVELIRQITRSGQSVLAVAPSNLGVDNLLGRLLDCGENAIRIGHPARVSPGLRDHTLDSIVENHPNVNIAHQLMREAHALRGKAAKHTRARPETGARRAMRQEAGDMLRDARKIEDQVVGLGFGKSPHHMCNQYRIRR